MPNRGTALRPPITPKLCHERPDLPLRGRRSSLDDRIDQTIAEAIEQLSGCGRAGLAYLRLLSGHARVTVPDSWERIAPTVAAMLLIDYHSSPRGGQDCATRRGALIDHVDAVAEHYDGTPPVELVFSQEEIRLSTELWAARRGRSVRSGGDGAANYRWVLRSIRNGVASLFPELLVPPQPIVASDARWFKPVAICDDEHFLITFELGLEWRNYVRAGPDRELINSAKVGLLLGSRGCGLDGTDHRYTRGVDVADPDESGVVWVTVNHPDRPRRTPVLAAFAKPLLQIARLRGERLLCGPRAFGADYATNASVNGLTRRLGTTGHRFSCPSPASMQAAWIRELLLRGAHPATISALIGHAHGQYVWRIMLTLAPPDDTDLTRAVTLHPHERRNVIEASPIQHPTPTLTRIRRSWASLYPGQR